MVKPKVLFLPKWYPNRMVPLNGNFIENHAIAISKYAAIAVLFVRSENRISGPKYDVVTSTEHGFPVVRVYFKKLNGISKILTPFRYLKAQFIGYKKVKTILGEPDLCHIHVLARSGMLARYLHARHAIPYVITEHWTGYVRGEYGGLSKWFAKKIAKNAVAFSTVTQYLADHIKKSGIEGNFEVIPNVVDTDKFIPAEKESTENTIVHISDLKDDHKNISGLLNSCLQLLQKRSDFELHIIGTGPDQEKLKALSISLGIEKRTKFLGELTGNDLVKAIQNCTFLSLFSNYETFGVVLIEALSCGKPVVASNLPAIKEFIGEQQGILVERGNETELTNAFDVMLNHNKTYNPIELRRYAEEKFSTTAVGKQFMNWYSTQLK